MEEIIKKIEIHQDNPDELSKIGLELASELFYHNTRMSMAELKEKQTVIDYIKEASTRGEKRSVAESELYGVTETFNDYGKLKAQAEAIIEILNMIKVRIKVLSNEKELSK